MNANSGGTMKVHNNIIIMEMHFLMHTVRWDSQSSTLHISLQLFTQFDDLSYPHSQASFNFYYVYIIIKFNPGLAINLP